MRRQNAQDIGVAILFLGAHLSSDSGCPSTEKLPPERSFCAIRPQFFVRSMCAPPLVITNYLAMTGLSQRRRASRQRIHKTMLPFFASPEQRKACPQYSSNESIKIRHCNQTHRGLHLSHLRRPPLRARNREAGPAHDGLPPHEPSPAPNNPSVSLCLRESLLPSEKTCPHGDTNTQSKLPSLHLLVKTLRIFISSLQRLPI